MKKILSIILAVVMVLSSVTFVMAADDIKITINGEAKKFDVMPQIIDGRTLVPMRAIFEALGAEVGWDDATKTATGKTASTTVALTIDNKEAKVNGKAVALDVPAQIIESRTMVPARFVAESLGCKVDWDGNTKTVIITMETKKEETTAPVTDSKLPAGGTVLVTQDDLNQVTHKNFKVVDGVFTVSIDTKPSADTGVVATFKTNLSGKIKKGDVCLVTFKARATKGTGYSKVFVQADDKGAYAKGVFARPAYGSDWTDCYLPFLGIDKDMSQIGIRFGGEAHTTEIKDFQLINYGTSVKPETLPNTYMDDGKPVNIYKATSGDAAKGNAAETDGDWSKMTVAGFEDGKPTPSSGINFWAVKTDGNNANSKYAYTDYAEAGISKPNTTEDFGSKLLKVDINCGEKGEYKGGISQGRINDIPAAVVPFEKGAKYRMSAWVYLKDGDNAGITLGVYSGTEINGFKANKKFNLKAGEWQKVSIEITAADANVGKTTGARFMFNGTVRTMFMDNLMFEKLGAFTASAAPTTPTTPTTQTNPSIPAATVGGAIIDTTLPQTGKVIVDMDAWIKNGKVASGASAYKLTKANNLITIDVTSANKGAIFSAGTNVDTAAAKTGDVLMLTFKARLISGGKDGKGYIKAQLEEPVKYGKAIFNSTSFGSDWTTCYMPFKMIENAYAGLGFRPAIVVQKIEIKDIQLINFGTSVTLDKLPNTICADPQ